MFTREWLISLIVSIPGLLLAITFHEFAHGWAAYLMGDRTARQYGRLSLNPMHHLDPVGALCMIFFRFGWAKPVPINSRNFKNQKFGIIMVSLAGPLTNFLLALISVICAGIIINANAPLYTEDFFEAIPNSAYIDPKSLNMSPAVEFLYMACIYSAILNAGFMVFNLIPIPPLDGSKILLEFLPHKVRFKVYQYERYFGLILILFVYLGTLTPFLGILREGVLSFICQITGMIF